jgi:hypothetical protein
MDEHEIIINKNGNLRAKFIVPEHIANAIINILMASFADKKEA